MTPDVLDAESRTLSGPVQQLPTNGQPVQQMQGRFMGAVAVQRPRSLPTVIRRMEEEATLSGESFYYGWSAGGEKIEGPSVKLANAAARCWGNCSVELRPVQETSDAWIFTAAFVDYETGFTIERQFRQAKKWQVYGKLDDARKEDVRFQIGQSKAIRNVILNAMPAGLIDRAMEVAKEGARAKLQKFIDVIDAKEGKGKGIVQAVDMVLKGLAKHGAKEDAVLRKLDIAERKAIDIDRLLILRGDLAALDSGEARADELYPATATEKLTEKLAGKVEEKPEKKAKKQNHIPGVDDPENDPRE